MDDHKAANPGSPSGEWSNERHHVAPEGAQRPRAVSHIFDTRATSDRWRAWCGVQMPRFCVAASRAMSASCPLCRLAVELHTEGAAS